METNKRTTVHLAFPDKHVAQKGKESFVDATLADIEDDEQIAFAGFLEMDGNHGLREWVSRWLSEDHVGAYIPPDDEAKKEIQTTILDTIAECRNVLPLDSFTVFVFPWLREFDASQEKMGRVTGFTPFGSVVHVYISPQRFKTSSLKETVAHEFNHAVFLRYHSVELLKDALVFEGLAENFQEAITQSRSPMSRSLARHEALNCLQDLAPFLNVSLAGGNQSEKELPDMYATVFLGGDLKDRPIKRWTGYSIGYHLVKDYISISSGKSWKELVEMNPRDIFEQSPFSKK